ncbi:MAG: Rieske 2Fe-2S domain-containing protein [Nitrospirae bacterium]|nr:Rieske 2Fe-2S domain-containing protein [Nitrospirota bacterium]MBI3604451.1 Rieske 2Fe-2S domain-containing protein [Nitrospirota bacterium]
MSNEEKNKTNKSGEMNRRKFFNLIGWGGLLASAGGSAIGTYKFMFPTVLYEPPTIFKIGKVTDFSMGVDERLKKERQIWVVRNERGLYVLVAICRHLGCTPNWFPDQQRFRCPCHGSIYDIFGNVRGGPAPRTLWRAGVSLDVVDNQVVVNFLTRQDPDPESTVNGLMVEEAPREAEPYFIKNA